MLERLVINCFVGFERHFAVVMEGAELVHKCVGQWLSKAPGHDLLTTTFYGISAKYSVC